jgi:hypothetical protein
MSFKTKASVAALAGALALVGVAGGATAAGANTVTAIPSLSGTGTSVKIDPGTAEALKSLGVSLAPTGSATFEAATSTITFPITSGYAEIHSDLNVKPGYIQGSIAHEGSGFSLSAGSTKVELSDFVVDPGNSMLYGTVGGTPKVPPAVSRRHQRQGQHGGLRRGAAGHRRQAHRHRRRRPEQGVQRLGPQGRHPAGHGPLGGQGRGDHL